MQYKTLYNNNKIPTLGFGTDYIPKGETVINAVTTAIETGYRHIDNADCYDNQEGVGIAINNCIKRGIVKREDLFIVSKVPDWKQGYEATIECCKNSLREMNLEYFDLYLVHSPLRARADWESKILETYKALEDLYKEGLIKNIGVANFARRHIMHLRKNVSILPVVNQVELHPEHQQLDVQDVCKKSYIQIVAWGALNQGRIFKNDTFIKLAEKYSVTPAQIAIRWSYQKGFCPLARSITPEHIKSNFDILSFEISSEDMQLLDNLDCGEWSNTHDDKLYKRNELQVKNTKYTRDFKLFSFISFLKEYKESNRITRWYFFGVPFLKVDTKTFEKIDEINSPVKKNEDSEKASGLYRVKIRNKKEPKTLVAVERERERVIILFDNNWQKAA